MRPPPLPDRDSRPWWDALGHHQLLVEACVACGRLRWPPRVLCGACGSMEWDWTAASGRATVASWIVNHHPFGDAFPPPYTVVTARLQDQEDILVPGGYSGPAVKPVALHMLAALAREQAVGVPLSGIGGIASWRDAAEFIALGAGSVQVCTENAANMAAHMRSGRRILRSRMIQGNASRGRERRGPR